MFEDFSFSRSSQKALSPPPSHDDSSNSISPTSSRCPSPPPGRRNNIRSCHAPLSIAELSHKLGIHNLQPQPPRVFDYTSLPTPPGDDETFYEDLSQPQIPQIPSLHSASSSTACRRLHRQWHTRLQCDAQHLRALADLVEGMVSTGSQCEVYQPSALPPHLTSPQSSPGASSSEEGEADRVRSSRRNSSATRTLAHRPSTELLQDRACVTKRTRMRKEALRRGNGQVRLSDR